MKFYSKENLLEGSILLVNKPMGWTSFQVVNKIRWSIQKIHNIKKIKVGHAGTLDPLASGLLVICTGKATKDIDKIQAQEKTYEGTFGLGATTPSYDLETAIDKEFDTSQLTDRDILGNVQKFIGEIDQHPPVFSAVRKDGKRLYEYARKGQEVEVPLRKVHIFDFEILNISLPHVDFRVRCSKGTYIRSLADDFGKSLDNGAHLSRLERTKIGNYSILDSLPPNELIDTVLRAHS